MTIAYSKVLRSGQRAIYITDYTGSFERPCVTDQALNVAPRWHVTDPVLYYSRLTNTKSTLISFDLNEKNRTALCTYGGVNMQPALSRDGETMIMCRSNGKTVQLYKAEKASDGKRIFKKLTDNTGTNAFPTLLPNGDVLFCSDFETGSSQIYRLNDETGETKRLTKGVGFCSSPAYCEKTGHVAYTRSLNGRFQLFSLDLSTGRERQLTFGPGHKTEPNFSPCGKYIFFSLNKRGLASQSPSHIAVLNCNSGRTRMLTHGAQSCGYPACSDKMWY